MNTNPTNLFASATRRKLRFDTQKGNLSLEEVWDLSLKSLDQVAQLVDSRLDEKKGRSFLTNPDARVNAAKQDDRDRLEILMFIIATKEEENKAAREAQSKQAQLTLLKGLRDKKTLESLESQDLNEIERQIAELEGTAAPAPAETATV